MERKYVEAARRKWIFECEIQHGHNEIYQFVTARDTIMEERKIKKAVIALQKIENDEEPYVIKGAIWLTRPMRKRECLLMLSALPKCWLYPADASSVDDMMDFVLIDASHDFFTRPVFK